MVYTVSSRHLRATLGEWHSLCAAVFLLAVGSALLTVGSRGSVQELAPWALLVLGLKLRPPIAATAPGFVLGVLVALNTRSPVALVPAIALSILQWADEQVQRRQYLLQHLEKSTHGRMQMVLENLMPPSVVHELRLSLFGLQQSKTASFVSRQHERLTVLQADLVGFTAFARGKPPQEVVCVVNGLFTIFDSRVELWQAYKMETIGDAYICVSGFKDYNDGRHSAMAMLHLGGDFVKAVRDYKQRCGLPSNLGLRVGIHTGPCVGGVVGVAMQRYHLFGRTMRIMERLEETAATDTVHFSENTRASAVREEQGQMMPMFERRPSDSALVTSKGDTVPTEEIDGLATFIFKPFGLQSRPEHSDAEDAPRFAKCNTTGGHFRRRPSGLGLDVGGHRGTPAAGLQALNLAVMWHAEVAALKHLEP